jgi:hypothetical protein
MGIRQHNHQAADDSIVIVTHAAPVSEQQIVWRQLHYIFLVDKTMQLLKFLPFLSLLVGSCHASVVSNPSRSVH